MNAEIIIILQLKVSIRFQSLVLTLLLFTLIFLVSFHVLIIVLQISYTIFVYLCIDSLSHFNPSMSNRYTSIPGIYIYNGIVMDVCVSYSKLSWYYRQTLFLPPINLYYNIEKKLEKNLICQETFMLLSSFVKQVINKHSLHFKYYVYVYLNVHQLIFEQFCPRIQTSIKQ